MMDDPRISAIQALVEPILAEHHLELVELICRPQGGQWLVRLLIDTPGGVTIQRCAKVNQLIGQALETSDVMEGSYTIEVSSPGLDRPLVSQRDFQRALGEDLILNLQLEDGRMEELEGMLLAVQAEAIVLKTSSGNVTVPLAHIRTAKKTVRW